jgi:hypothetical protein
MNRPTVTEKDLDRATMLIVDNLTRRMQKHGCGAYVSRHEAFGVIAEEFQELGEALRADMRAADFEDEASDIAVACLFALASRSATERQKAEDDESYKMLEAKEDELERNNLPI